VVNKYVSDSKNQIYVGEEIKIIKNYGNPASVSCKDLHFFNSHIGGGGGVVQTGSTRHVGHFWPIVLAPGDCEDGEFGGMTIGRENNPI
jgi:hypothetical protein